MNTTQAPNRPTDNATLKSGGGGKLYLTLQVPGVEDCEQWCPKNNMVASQVLARLLDTVLESAGQLVAPTQFIGALNQSVFFISVRHAYESGRIIQSELERFSLTSCADMFHLDMAELTFFHIYPAPAKACSPAELNQKIISAVSLENIPPEKRAMIDELLDQLRKSMQDPPPPSPGEPQPPAGDDPKP